MNTTNTTTDTTSADATSTFSFSNTCDCATFDCQICTMLFVGSSLAHTTGELSCPHCGAHKGSPASTSYTAMFEELGNDYVDCACWEENTDYVDELWQQWKAQNPAPFGYYIIKGKNMGWQNRSASKVIHEANISLYIHLSVNTEWVQRWSTDTSANTPLEVTLSHHDSPTGEQYTVRPASLIETTLGIYRSDDHGDTWPFDIAEVINDAADYYADTPGTELTQIEAKAVLGLIDELCIEVDDTAMHYLVQRAD